MNQDRSRITPGHDDPEPDLADRAVGERDDAGVPESDPPPPDGGVAAHTPAEAGAGSSSPAPGAPPDGALGDAPGRDGNAESVNRAAACPNGFVGAPTESMPIGMGLIIPAYIGINDLTSWNILKEDVPMPLQDGSSVDYWVTVNGPNSGPFVQQTEWDAAKAVFDPIRCNGGRIIGYVHTCEKAIPPRTTHTKFRPLETVEGEIDQWVNGYPALDGIWLDEFIPRLEVASIVEDGQPLIINPGPNPEYAPTDPSYLTNGDFNGNQVHPAGGYYSRLVDWIHTAHPNLRIIGNAGGWVDNNQLEYPALVDVFVSFEQRYDVASQNNWKGLERQVDTVPQLALIHTNTNDARGAVKQAFDHGYTHAYTTSLPLVPNVWGGLPPYFTTEVSDVVSILTGQ